MATIVKVRRISNPRHHRRRANATVKRNRAKSKANGHRKRSNARHHKRRKMSPKQIRIFGTRAQKAALKRRKNTASPHRKRTNPRPAAKRKNSRKRSNPALVVTLGSIANPRKRSNKMAATKRSNRRRRSSTARHHRRRRRNPMSATGAARSAFGRSHKKVANRRRRRATVRHHRRHRSRTNPKIIVMRPNRRRNGYRRRRNPQELFGQPLFGRNSLELVGGGLLGLVAAKFIPTLFPASITGGIASSSIGRIVISGVAAVVGAWAGSKISPAVGQGMLFGGLIQTASIALNAFLPNVYSQLNPSLGRLGDLTPGAFAVPQNPILAGRSMATLPPAAAAIAANGGGGQVRMPAGQSGLGRAYGSAY